MLQGLLSANEEFVEEVKRLYREEEAWEQETSKLKEEKSKISEHLNNELKKLEDDVEEEKTKFKIKEDKLVESIQILSLDNNRLLQERDTQLIISSKSHQVRDAAN